MERVTTIAGKEPILFIAPHGYDDKNTAIIAEAAALALHGYAVINHGWERDNVVDEAASKANCNNIGHCCEDVVCEEFLEPIEDYYRRVVGKWGHMDVYIIHGCGNDARLKTSPTLTAIIGFGEGPKPSYSCDKDLRDSLTYIVNSDKIWEFWQAGPSSRFSGWGRDNLNQLWRKHSPNEAVNSMQIEFVSATRNTEADAEVTGKQLARYIDQANNTAMLVPSSWKPKVC